MCTGMFCSSAFSPSPNGLPHPTIILLNPTDFYLHDTYPAGFSPNKN